MRCNAINAKQTSSACNAHTHTHTQNIQATLTYITPHVLAPACIAIDGICALRVRMSERQRKCLVYFSIHNNNFGSLFTHNTVDIFEF